MAHPKNPSSPLVQELMCESCKTPYYRYRSTNPNSAHHFCSKSCYGLGISTGLVALNPVMTDEVKMKISKKAKERLKSASHPFLGRTHSIESKNKMAKEQEDSGRSKGANNPMYGKQHTAEAREAMSEKHSLGFVEGRRKQYGKNGHLHGSYVSTKTKMEMTYRSSWELAAMKWLDANEAVRNYTYETIRIPYYHMEDNRKYRRYYVPDFLITFTDGHAELWELKPVAFVNNEKTLLKTDAALNYCKNHQIDEFAILSKEELLKRGIL